MTNSDLWWGAVRFAAMFVSVTFYVLLAVALAVGAVA